MDTKTASYLGLVSAPVAFLLGWLSGSSAIALLLMVLVIAGLAFSAIAYKRAILERDKQSRTRAIGGMALNGLYLILFFVAMAYVFPKAVEDAEKLKEQVKQKETQPQQKTF